MLVPLLSNNIASAYGQITTRSIKMSSSANGATDVTYQASFITATTSNIGGLVIDFCANSPIIEASCTAPTGFDANTAGLALANQVGITDFAVNNIGTADDANTIVLTRTAASVSSATTVTFDLGSTGGSDGITNPTTTNTTFYARIITFNSNAGAQGYTSGDMDAGDPNSDVDAGGVALSTAEQLIVTAKVPERLVFCIYVDTGQAPANDCTGKTGSAVNLGDDNGALHVEGEFVNKDAFYGVSTNAGGGTVIRVKGDTLTSGSDTIDAITTEAGSTIGTEQFGLCNYEDQGSGLTLDTKYDGTDGITGNCSTVADNSGTATTGNATPDGTWFTFDTNTTDGTASTYGDELASKAAGDFSTGNIAFVGNIAPATEAGIYLSTLTFIATGTY